MYTFSRTVAIAAFTLISAVSATFDPTSKNNVVTYWGQGAYQQRLLETCKNPSIDIINIAFVNVFPDQGPGGYPGTNFGNACWGDVYKHNGVNTDLLKTCPDIGLDIIECQQTYGKKIFLSLGGDSPGNYYIDSDATGKKFATFLWKAFGPVPAKYTGPRPWGNATVDGFDFDVESLINPAPTADYMTSGYATMINQLKNALFPQDTSKRYYISGAPQCTIPDAHFTDILSQAWFDFLFIQFYNTQKCSARMGIKKLHGQAKGNDISYSQWTNANSLNPNVRMSIGLPASVNASSDATYYLTPAEAQTLVQQFYGDDLFGGIMLWEATYNQNHTICGNDYGTWMKKILNAQAKGKTIATTCKAKRSEITTTSISVCTETSTLIYRSSTKYSTYEISHTLTATVEAKLADPTSTTTGTPTASGPQAAKKTGGAGVQRASMAIVAMFCAAVVCLL